MTHVDLQEESERALAHLAQIEPAILQLFAGDGLSEEQHEALLTVFGMGVLSGIWQGLEAARGNQIISYDALIPDTPEELL